MVNINYYFYDTAKYGSVLHLEALSTPSIFAILPTTRRIQTRQINSLNIKNAELGLKHKLPASATYNNVNTHLSFITFSCRGSMIYDRTGMKV